MYCLSCLLFLLVTLTGYVLCITKTRLFKYIENFTSKNWKFSNEKFWYFHISAQNIDCGYPLEPPRRGGSNEYPQFMCVFFSRNKKNDVYPCKPHFYYIKVGIKGVKIIWACFRDGLWLVYCLSWLNCPLFLLVSLVGYVLWLWLAMFCGCGSLGSVVVARYVLLLWLAMFCGCGSLCSVVVARYVSRLWLFQDIFYTIFHWTLWMLKANSLVDKRAIFS